MIRTFPADYPHLYTALQTHGAIRIPQFITEEAAASLLFHLKLAFVPSRDNVEAIGAGRHAQALRRVVDGPLSRFVRVMHEPPLRPEFEQLVRLRNYLSGQVDDPEGWWTASRFNHYPAGGGWMATHRDLDYMGGEEPPGKWVQPILLLTKKGRDFHVGGGHVNGEDVDAQCDPGDVIVYTGHVEHGVNPVDPFTPFNPSTLDGRVVAMVTLYRRLPDDSKRAGKLNYWPPRAVANSIEGGLHVAA